MNYFPLYQYFIYNGKIKANAEFRFPENVGGVYEVIRVASGVPLFLEAHLDRFFSSAALADKQIRFSKNQIAVFIAALIEANQMAEGNILLSCKQNLKAFFIPHKYPGQLDYLTGVKCGTLQAERHNPNAKVFQTTVRQQADDMIEERGYYEVLLVDGHHRITEGSRSNVFFVRDNMLFTPPGNEVLLGVTRQKVLLLAKDAGIPVREQDVSLHDLHAFQAAFITGTSPKILPLLQIDDRVFDPRNGTLQMLRKKYDALIERYIRIK